MASNVQVKVKFGEEVRRFTISPETTNFAFVREKLRDLFYNGDDSARFYVRYEDDDGDMVTMASDEELEEAIRQVFTKSNISEQILRITTAHIAPPPPRTSASTAAPPVDSKSAQAEGAEKSASGLLPPFISNILSNPAALSALDAVNVSGPLYNALPGLLGHALAASEQLHSTLNSETRLPELLQLCHDVLPRVPHIAAAFARDQVHEILTAYAPQFAVMLRDFLQSCSDVWSTAAQRLSNTQFPAFTPMTLLPLLPYVMGQSQGQSQGRAQQENPFASLFGGGENPLAALFSGAGLQPQQPHGDTRSAPSPPPQSLASLLGGLGRGASPGSQANPLMSLLGALGHGMGQMGTSPQQATQTHTATGPTRDQTQQQQQQQQQVVHGGVTCDVCGVSPITGSRYNCSVCYNYDLCSNCEAGGRHDPAHPLIKMQHVNQQQQQQQAPVHPQTVTPEAAVEDDPELETKLHQLSDMGFVDRAENIELLRKNGGSVNRVVMAIVEGQY